MAERVPRHRREYWTRQFLVAVRANPAGLTPDLLDEFAGPARTGYSERHLRRIAMRGAPYPQRSRFEASEEVLALVVDCRGNIAHAYDRYKDLPDSAVVSYPTFWRAVERALSPRVRADMRHGERANRALKLTVPVATHHRNYLWSADFKDLHHPLRGPDGEVLLNEKGEPIHAQSFSLVDGHTSAVVWSELIVETTADIVFVALIEAFCCLGPDSQLGGIPVNIVTDNDTVFKADRITRLLDAFKVDLNSTDIYSPEQNGWVESFHALAEGRYCRSQPGFSHGPATADGKLLSGAEHAPTVPEARSRWAEFIHQVNYRLRSRRPGEALRSRIERWTADSEPVRVGDVSAYRELLNRRRSPVTKNGIHLYGDHFFLPRLATLRGKKVEVYYMPRARQRVFLAYDGEWLGEAKRRTAATEADRSAVRREHAKDRRRIEALRRERAEREAAGAAGMESTPRTADDPETSPDLLGRLARAERRSKRPQRDPSELLRLTRVNEPEADDGGR
jgi:putative transposase